MLSIKNLVKSYDLKQKAVNNVSLEIPDGTIFGFIGHNGAGKTTTIKCIAGLLPFEGGEITVNGIDVVKNPLEAKRQIVYIPDNPDIYDSLTGIQFLNFISDIYALDKQQRNMEIKKYADLFELTSNLGDAISSYSHGMKQKLVLISAFIRHPKLLIFDEPFVGLDPKASHVVKKLMHDMCDEGNSVFFSTHVLEVAEKLCDQVAIISHGEIKAYGSMDEVRGDQSLEDVFLDLEGGAE